VDSKVFFLQSESDESRLGVCFHGRPLTGADEGTMDRLKSVLTMTMPAGTFIQFGLFSEPDVSSHAGDYLAAKSETTKLLKRMSTKRAEFLSDGVETPINGMNDIHLCRQRIVVSLSIPCETIPTQRELKTASELSDKLREGLTSVGLWLSQMDERQYVALLRRFFHLYDKDDFVTDEFASLREQVFSPSDSVKFGTDTISFNDGEYHAKMMSIKHFPKVASIGLMNMLVGDPMGSNNQVGNPFWLSATIFYPDQDKKVTKVRAKHAWISNQQARLIPMLGYKKAGIDKLTYEMDNGGGMLCEVNFTMTLFSRHIKELNGLASSFRAWASSFGFDMREDRRILKPLFYSLLPLGATKNGIENLFRFHTLAMSHAIHLLPLIGNWDGSGAGASSIFNLRRGTLALFDPYDSPTNQNGIIIAEPGAGKSYLAQQLLCDWMAGGARAWVIDQGRSFEKLCRALGGQFIEFSESSDLCLNPFTHILDIDEEMDLLKAMFAKMAAPEHGLDDFRMAALEGKIKAAYSTAGTKADVELVMQQCLHDPDQRIKDIGTQLYPFSRQGSFGRWFNGVNNVDMSNDLVVLELKELASKKTLQQVVLIQLFSTIGHQMYLTHNGRKKAFLLDEAWAILDDPVMGKAVEAMYRTVRKEKGSAWLVTQNIADLYDSPNGRAIIGSSAWQIVMMQKSDSIDAAIRSGHLSMDVYQMQMLKSINTSPGRYAEMMIRNGDNWGVVKLVTDRFSQILFSTKGWERDLVFERMNAGEDVVEIIDEYVLEGRK
jgi:conjugal transfer ATP-binding protein TraC